MSFIYLLLFAVVVFSETQGNIRIGVACDSNYVGEREVAWRIKIAGEHLGWTVVIDEEKGRNISQLKDLDWVICLVPENEFHNPYCLNFLIIFHPFNYFDNHRILLPFYQKYDGYLLTVDIEKDLFILKDEDIYTTPFYPSIYKTDYIEIPFKEITTMIAVWSNRLHVKKFKDLYKLLSETTFVKFYGVAKNEDILPQGYMGSIPFDGVSVIDILQQHGITLVLHSDIHNSESIPSSRIFESAAASTVIISDQNPFVKTHFGDSVFYIDTSCSTESIYDQILAHLETIYTYPEKAREMAKKAHQIFSDNFEMSNQLLKIESLHQKIIKNQGSKI